MRDGRMGWKGSFGAPDAQDGDFFGSTIPLMGSDLLVGAPGMNNNARAAYSFGYRNSARRLNQKLTQTGTASGNLFGYSVSFRNGMAAVGAPGGRFGANDGEVPPEGL